MTELPTYHAERKALHKALAQAQGEFPPIPKTSTADAGSYTYQYADLASIIAIVRPVLAAHGLALIQRLESPNGTPAIRTELLHADGATIASSFPIGDIPQNVQQLGSKITYLRRYTVVAMLGLAAGEDDDGHTAGQAPVARTGDTTASDTAAGAEPSPFQPPEHLDELGAVELTDGQRKNIFRLLGKLEKTGKPGFTKDAIKAAIEIEYGTRDIRELTRHQASNLIDRLMIAAGEKEPDAE